MDNLILFMLLGWLGCTLVMTIRASARPAEDLS
jgi:hypothetical protein